MTSIERSHGVPVKFNGTLAGIVGGGGTGVTSELDATVQRAADLLAETFQLPVTIRFNSDRESGGAWLKLDDPDGIGRNNQVGISASVMTERRRRRLEESRERDARDPGMQEWVDYYDEWLASPEGQVGAVSVYCHLRRDVIEDILVAESLCEYSDYCHLPVPTIEHAIAMAVACVGELHGTALDG